MPIILAIESDRRQRDALAAVVRERVGAELILADTTERALEAIGNRVPDLVLVPALLLPSDDAALAAALRVIAAAAHVRTLTIPVLAAHSASESKGGLFSRWRRGNTPQSTDGCDPALFAEQIVAYLKESAAERALFAEQEEEERLRARDQPQDDPEPQAAAADAFVHAGAVADFPPEMQSLSEPEEPRYVQPEAPAAAYSSHDAFAATPETASYSRADAEIYAPADTPVPIYTPTYSYGAAQFDSEAPAADTSAATETPAYASHEEPIFAEPEPAYQAPHEAVHAAAEVEAPEFAGVDFSARLQEVVGVTEEDSYDAQPTGHDVPTLEIEQEEDIDLSDELAELEGEESAETGEELFDGEPIGIYTMPTLTDESEFEMPRFTFGRPRVESTPRPEARFEAAPVIEPVAKTFVAPEFFVEETFEPEVEATELEPVAAVRAEAIAAHASHNEDAAPVEDEWDAADAEPEPADAEPWLSSGLNARWGWPVIEGIPTDSPAAGFARADSLAAAAEPLAAPKPAPAAPRAVPPPSPAVVVPRAAPAPLPSIQVPRSAPAAAAAAAPRPAGSAAKSTRPDWSELVASLRKDIERRRVEPPQEKPKPKPSTTEAAAAPAPAPVMRRSRKAKPIQDEWGFFDPEQCGFAALLAKLDEITEGAEEPEVRQTT
jgi:hypothetical protein